MKRTIPIILTFSLLAALAQAQSPNERVHVLQKRDYSVKNKIEIGLFGGASIGDVFTQQYTGTLALDYHIGEAFALEAMWLSCKVPFMNGSAVAGSPGEYQGDGVRFGNRYTGAYDEITEAQLRPSNADLAMIGNYVGLHVQYSPMYGKWSFFNWGLGHVDFYLSAGGGVASTEYKNFRRNWVDTGNYFVGSFGMGLRIFLARWVAIRLDLRDFTFAARVKTDSGGQGQSGDETKIRNTLFFMAGVSFLFGGEAPVEIWSPY